MTIPGSAWRRVPGRASDVGVGADGSVYHVGQDGRIYRWDGGNGWIDVRVCAVGDMPVSVGPTGDVWFSGAPDRAPGARIVMSGRQPPFTEHPTANDDWPSADAPFVTGGPNDIGVGADGTAWVCVNKTQLIQAPPPQMYQAIRYYSPRGWTPVPGHGTRISGGNGTNPWHVGDDQNLYRWSGAQWVQIPDTKAFDIGVGPNDEAWHVGTEDQVYYFDTAQRRWLRVEDQRARRIAVGPRGLPWVVTGGGDILRRLP
jgi:hypothetical protein